MRVLLVGPAFERDRLRRQLRAAGLDVAGEFTSLAAAEAARLEADAIVVGRGAPPLTASLDPDGLGEPTEALTSREIQVLELLAEGLSNKGIADRLGISDQTVKFHVASISGKLGAVNRTDAVRRAVRRGLIAL
jgi:DNA-binding NarL/FixJ family response regulator